MGLDVGTSAAHGALMRGVHGDQPHERSIRVLAIDGGGVRGIVPAMVMAEMEARTGKSIADLFDIVAGTSTGVVLAVGAAVPQDAALPADATLPRGVAHPGHPSRPRWRAADGVEIYRSRLPEVFNRSAWETVARIGGVLHEKYDEEYLEDVLAFYFGDHMLSEAVTHVVVPAYDLASQDVILFDSAAAKADPALDLPMRVVVRGATAAPTYFEPKPVDPPVARRHHLLVDGGVFANNPGVCAFMQAQHHHLGADVVMVSLGTGSPVHPFHMEEVRSWGLAHWARPLFSLVMDGVTQATHNYLGSLLGEERYFRFELSLEGCSHRLDDASGENLEGLERAALRLVAEREVEIERICRLLTR